MPVRKVFVFYSPSLDEFYFGESEDHQIKLIKLNSGFYDVINIVPKATDWEVKIVIDCNSRCQAIKVLKHLSTNSNRSYINNLANHAVMVQRLLERFCSQSPESIAKRKSIAELEQIHL
jgi:putative endonuclease